MRTSVLLAIILASATAFANGRSPETNGIFLPKNDPHTLYIATTFGLLVSHDEGCTTSWICEDNIGYSGPFDPDYALAADGTLYATTNAGLRISHDGGCSFTTASGGDIVANEAIQQVDLGPNSEVWIVMGESGKTNDVLESIDGGTTFASRGLATQTRFYKSIAAAQSDAKRVYITGFEAGATPTAHLLRTTDTGAHWTESPLTGVAGTDLMLHAVDPANADILYLVSVEPTPGMDQLYRSADGGQTFTKVLDAPGLVHDVVIAGNEVFVTTLVRVGKDLIGGPAFHSTDGGVTLSMIPAAPQIGCLARRSDGVLFGCGSNWDPDFKAVWKSEDNGATYTKIWRFVEMAGALACPAGTPQHDVCDVQQWSGMVDQFAPKGPACGANMVVDDPAPQHHGGCCETGGEPASDAVWALGVLLVVTRGSRSRSPRSRAPRARRST